jgi:hypothetical protein
MRRFIGVTPEAQKIRIDHFGIRVVCEVDCTIVIC